MRIETYDRVEIFVLPDSAKCKVTSESPENMIECPMREFDADGSLCIPDCCIKYTEEGADE